MIVFMKFAHQATLPCRVGSEAYPTRQSYLWIVLEYELIGKILEILHNLDP